MLEAQVIISDSPDGIALKGDVLVVALPGHPWGTLDKVHFLVVQWDDAALELQLLQRQRHGEAWPVKAYPYVVTKEPAITKAGTPSLYREMTRLSTKTLDLSRVPWYTDKTIDKPILAATDYTLAAEVSDSVGIFGTIKNAVRSAWKALVG